MFSRGVSGFVALTWTILVAACAPPPPASFPKESISVPDDVDHYATEPRPDGAVGGPGIDQVQVEIADALAKRGDHAELDGSLGATASWALRRVYESRPIDAVGGEAASRHFGFGGTFIAYLLFDRLAKKSWDEQLAPIPRNLRITRYGIRLSPSGRVGALVIGSMEASYAPIPRAFDPGQSVNLKGETTPRFESCEVLLTKPDGSVDKKAMPRPNLRYHVRARRAGCVPARTDGGRRERPGDCGSRAALRRGLRTSGKRQRRDRCGTRTSRGLACSSYSTKRAELRVLLRSSSMPS